MSKFVVVVATLGFVFGTASSAADFTSGGPAPTGHGPSNAGAPHGGGGGPGGGGHHGGGHHGGGHGGRGGGVVIFNPYGYWPYPAYPYPYPYPDAPYPDAPYPPPGSPPPPPSSSRDAADAMSAGPFWYYCDQPAGYYPYVKSCEHAWTALAIAPPPPGTGAPISDGTWSWCDDPKGYFPYVAKCQKWKSVPVTIPLSEGGPDGVPITADWFYCEDPAGYMPYVATCAKDWRAVPSIPPPNVDRGSEPPHTTAH